MANTPIEPESDEDDDSLRFDENINLPEVSINSILNDSGLIGRSSERLALNEKYLWRTKNPYKLINK